ncbi:hypothetical protein BT69DRAFT_1321109 [Atractiella rhizophila]|nr:hypothetical protein BT69DRAFT_1321109 [Atractiella rhizophila]
MNFSRYAEGFLPTSTANNEAPLFYSDPPEGSEAGDLEESGELEGGNGKGKGEGMTLDRLRKSIFQSAGWNASPSGRDNHAEESDEEEGETLYYSHYPTLHSASQSQTASTSFAQVPLDESLDLSPPNFFSSPANLPPPHPLNEPLVTSSPSNTPAESGALSRETKGKGKGRPNVFPRPSALPPPPTLLEPEAQDTIFFPLFALNSFAFLLTSTFSHPPGHLTILGPIALVLSAAVLALLRTSLLLVLPFIIPSVLILAGIAVLGYSLMVGVLLLGAGGIQSLLAYRALKDAKRTSRILSLSTEVLTLHPPLIAFDAVLALLLLFNTLPLLSSLPTTTFHFSPTLGSLWKAISWAWITGFLVQVRRSVAGGVVGGWFFNRHEPTHPPPYTLVSLTLNRTLSSSLGTISRASLLLAVFGLVSFTLRRLVTLSRASRLLPLPFGILALPLNCLAPLASRLEGMSERAVVYASLTGMGWTESVAKSSRLRMTRRQGNISGLTPLVSGAGAGIAYAVATTWEAMVLGALVAAVTERFVVGSVEDVALTMRVALAIDEERKTVHCVKATEAFAEDLGDAEA